MIEKRFPGGYLEEDTSEIAQSPEEAVELHPSEIIFPKIDVQIEIVLNDPSDAREHLKTLMEDIRDVANQLEEHAHKYEIGHSVDKKVIIKDLVENLCRKLFHCVPNKGNEFELPQDTIIEALKNGERFIGEMNVSIDVLGEDPQIIMDLHK